MFIKKFTEHYHVCKEMSSLKFLFSGSLPKVVGCSGGSVVKNSPAYKGDTVWSLGQEDPVEKGMQPTPVFLPGESHGQRSLVDYSLWGHKESGTTNRLTLSLHCKFLRICLNLSTYNFSTFCFLFKNPLSSHENVLLCYPLNF